MKRLLCLVLTGLISMTVAGCSSGNTSVEDTTKAVVSQTESTTEEPTEETTEVITESITEKINLSDDCTMILCTGTDGDNYYELVMNQIDDFPNTKYEFGVIKNNEWLVEMSANCPFIDHDGRWKGLESHEENTVSSDKFLYLDEGVFIYNNLVIYKPETGISFDVWNTDQTYDLKYDEVYVDDREMINSDGLFLGFEANTDDFKLFNMNTGESTLIGGFFAEKFRDDPEIIYGFSDGLFYASYHSQFSSNGKYSGFFDLNGKQIIDLYEYDCTDLKNRMFVDGKYTATCKNDSGVEYDITFDTTGKIISKEKIS